MEAWEKISDELVKKSWTGCGYPQEKDLTTNNENAMVVWSEKDIGAMVEAPCGPEIRTNFDDVECGPDKHFPSDDECSSDNECSDDNENEDDNVEEVCVEPATFIYDQYILTTPIGKSGNPTPPSRQLLSTWVVEAWEEIPEELVKKSWTACGYPQGKDVTANNANAIVVW